MGWRLHRVFSIFPWLRLNLSKSGVSGSVGPRGADVNIGRHGVTTNASLPGTGISYRQKMGTRGTLLGIVLLVLGLAFALYRYNGDINAMLGGQRPPSTTSTSQTTSLDIEQPAQTAIPRSFVPRARTPKPRVHATRAPRAAAGADVIAAAVAARGTLYVSRNNSDLRSAPSYSAAVLTKIAKGAQVTLLATSDKWRKVRDGAMVGWMRAGTLRDTPPGTKKPRKKSS